MRLDTFQGDGEYLGAKVLNGGCRLNQHWTDHLVKWKSLCFKGKKWRSSYRLIRKFSKKDRPRSQAADIFELVRQSLKYQFVLLQSFS